MEYLQFLLVTIQLCVWPGRTAGRYIVLLFKTESFSGQVVSSDEGEMEWVECDRLSEINTVDDLDDLLKAFNDPDLNEFQYFVDGDNWTISIK